MVVCLVFLALGKNTPLFQFLFDYCPGFNMFRGTSKFLFPTTIFLTMLAAIGMDALFKDGLSSRKPFYILIITGVVLFGSAWLVLLRENNFLFFDICGKLMQHVDASGETYLPSDIYKNSLFLDNASMFAAKGLFSSSAVVFTLAIIVYLSNRSHRFLCLISLLAIAEIFFFAGHIKTDFPLTATKNPVLTKFLRERPGDYRILNLMQPNSAMSINARDIWGYDPGVLLRYAQFIGFTQGYDPHNITNYIDFRENHRLLKMLRLRFIFIPEGPNIKIIENKHYLPRTMLMTNWEVITKKEAIWKRMAEEGFDPRRTVILEKSPEIADSGPVETNKGSCGIADESTDHLTVSAKTSRDAILLVTDNYSKGLRITPLDNAVQQSY